MQRRSKNIVRRPELHHASGIHNAHSIGNLVVNAHIVRNNHQRIAHLRLQFHQHLQNALLNHNVQRRRRLVGKDHAGMQKRRHRNHHALPHSAGQLMRIGFQHVARQTHLVQIPVHPLVHRLSPFAAAMPAEQLVKLIFNPVNGIQNALRRLRHIRNRIPPCAANAAGVFPIRNQPLSLAGIHVFQLHRAFRELQWKIHNIV